MPRLAEREENILDFIIRDYVESAVPVSSGRVFDAGLFKASPATIRNVMLELDDEGFLEQPHTSAGRVPTDKAYRYFVDNLMAYHEPARHEREIFDELARRITKRHELLFENFGKMMAEELGLFASVANFGAKKRVRGFGFEELLREPEFENHDLSVEFARVVDHLDEAARQYLESSSEEKPEVFIGEENPLKAARSFSTVAFRFSDGKIGKCVVFAMGPKRMDYERISSVLDFATRDIMERI